MLTNNYAAVCLAEWEQLPTIKIYSKWSVQVSKQASKQAYAHVCSAVTLVLDSLQLTRNCTSLHLVHPFSPWPPDLETVQMDKQN